jgi:hypothetical protein
MQIDSSFRTGYFLDPSSLLKSFYTPTTPISGENDKIVDVKIVTINFPQRAAGKCHIIDRRKVNVTKI